MFGSLFEEDETVDDLQTELSRLHVVSTDSSHFKKHSASKRTKSAMIEPPAPRTEVKLCGLDNLGATCYLNSLVQTLLYTPEFRDALFKLESKHLGSLEDQDKPNSNVRRIPIQLQRLFARLLLEDIASTTTTDLVASFGWTDNENFEQQDVQELHHTLMSAIEKSLVYTPGQDIVSQTFYGKLVNQIECLSCGDISESKEDFLDISVSLTSKGYLENGLSAAFIDAEKMVGKNRYKCSSCGQLVDASKKTKLHKLPPILGFSLLRFIYDIAKLKSIKDKRKFKFPKELDVAPYCDKVLPPEDTKYELFSVLIHRGSAHSGHYHVYIKDIDGLGQNPFMEEVEPSDMPLVSAEPFVPLSSHPVSPPPSSQLSTNTEVSPLKGVDLNDPVKLASFILSRQPDEKIKFADMEKKIFEVKGESWSLAFQNEHGPLPKFILRSDVFNTTKDVIMFDRSKFVQRKKKPSGDNNNKSTKSEGESVISTVTNGVADNGVHSIKADCRPSELTTPPLKSPTQLSSWYDFNDSCVLPIHSSDLKNLFGGEECAYMLFYRRKSLKRPLEAIGNPCYGIPESLTQLIHAENQNLKSEREAYDLAINTIVINVHLGDHYNTVNGGLFPICENQYSIPVNVNKEGTLADLYDAVRMACCIEAGSRFTLTFAKVFSGGLHLYENISESCVQHLREKDLKDGDNLFLWDGHKIEGCETVMSGKLHEPLLLNFNHTAEDGNLIKLSHSFPKNSTLAHLVIAIAEKLQTAPERLFLKHGAHCSNFMDETTLVELGIPDGYYLNVEILNSDFDVDLAKANKVCLNIKSDFSDLLVPEKSTTKQGTIFNIVADRTKTVGEVRKMALKFLDLAFTTNCRLSVVKDDFEFPVPLFEDQTVFESSLSVASEIILENGLPPAKGQLTLRILTSSGDNINLNINKFSSVEKCLQKVIRTANLEGSNWCLRPKIWSGDVGKALPNNSSSLCSLSIQHGASIIVEQCVSTVTLSIWFHPNASLSSSSSFECTSSLGSGDDAFKELMAACPTQPTQLGELCIPASAKLEELKRHILVMPLLENIPPPKLGQIRIRTLLENRPSRVLRGPRKMLKSLKIVDKAHLCVQLLPSDENLSTNAVVLSVVERLPDIRGYHPPREIILDCGPSISIAQFKDFLAVHLSMMVENIHVAKKDFTRCGWIVIEEQLESFTEKHLRHKSAKNVRNVNLGLTVGNVTLYDGDVLGVKDLTSSSGSRNDFGTDEDDLTRQQGLTNVLNDQFLPTSELPLHSSETFNGAITRGIDENHRQSKVQRTCGSEPIQTKTSSQGITIHVGDFSQYSHFP